MNLKEDNYLTKKGKEETIKLFQNTAYQIVYGDFVNNKFKTRYKVHDYNKLVKKCGESNFPSLKMYYICYYHIKSTETGYVVTFLNNELEIMCVTKVTYS